MQEDVTQGSTAYSLRAQVGRKKQRKQMILWVG